jgi:hypothetical protein
VSDSLDDLRRGALAGARRLTLKAGLTQFPPEIFDLADTLEVLDLSHNALAELPHDLSRLRHLRALFCSFNQFDRLPAALGDCAQLSQVGFRGNAMRELPAEALPPQLRWLTLTDNRLEDLPATLGERPALQKLMLAGNRLTRLPEGLSQARHLELLRLAANRFEALPGWLTQLPRLAWLAWSGNPLDAACHAPAAPAIAWNALQPGALLGEGASGLIHHALWQGDDGLEAPRAVALKLFKGAMTSDGLPEREMAACLAAGEHPHLTGALGQISGHPEQAQGLVMPLLPSDWQVLAGPPSLQSCSRDVYDPALRLAPGTVHRLALSVARAAEHLHRSGLLHGDLYAHNTLWDGRTGQAVLSDFGAASFLPAQGPKSESEALQRLEVRAWGLLLGELLARCESPSAVLTDLQQRCIQPLVAERPLMADVVATLITNV